MHARRVLALVSFWVLVLTGCATTQQVAHQEYEAPSGKFRLIVMEPDISVFVLTAGGMLEPREDWTMQAREHVLQALRQQPTHGGGEITIASTVADAGGDAESLRELAHLHSAVGQAIKLHKYSPIKLPTKTDQFDWTLGQLAVDYGRATNYDYALFLHAQDSFSSGGRVALQAASFLGCMVGVCVMPTGGLQVAFASLVDLRNGQVIWFNSLADSTGDIRTEEGARRMVDKLLAGLQPDKVRKTSRS